MPDVPIVQLNDGNAMPCVGLGLWRVLEQDTESVVREAISAGYRSFDTAAFYGNEEGLGRGICQVSIDRRNLFVTSKVWNDRHGYDETMRAFDESMDRLELDYIDLFLIHWPVAGSEKYVDTWKALVALRKQGRAKSIGVSNFLPCHVRRIIDDSGVVPAVNQIEYHPYFRQAELARTCAELGILVEAWAPLGRGAAMEEPAITKLAAAYGKTPAQIILRWHLDQGRAAIPKTGNPARMRENIDVFDFSLTAGEIATIDAIATAKRHGGDPETFTGLDL